MRHLPAISAAAMIGLGAADIAHAGSPVFELNGFPITRHQLIAVDTGQVRERSPAAALTMAGMPVSPHQVAVLSPRPILTAEQLSEKLTEAGVTRVRFVGPGEYTVIGMQNGGWTILSVDSRTGRVATGLGGR